MKYLAKKHVDQNFIRLSFRHEFANYASLSLQITFDSLETVIVRFPPFLS